MEAGERIIAALARCRQCETGEDGEVLSVYLSSKDLAEIFTQALKADRMIEAQDELIETLREQVAGLEFIARERDPKP